MEAVCRETTGEGGALVPYTGDLLSVRLETEGPVCQELQPLVEVYSESRMNV